MEGEAESRPGRGSLLGPIHQRVLREEILDFLRSSILDGQLARGTRLIENDVASQMGTSRVPVREAIRQLQQEGLVEIVPHRGAIVAAIGDSELHTVYEIRALIEAQAMERAAVTATPEDLARLDRLCSDMEHALRMEDLAQVTEIDRRFHDLILEMAGFGIVRHVWASVDGLVRAAAVRFLGGADPEPRNYLHGIGKRHRELLATLVAGDPVGAAAAARAHVLELRDAGR